MFNYLQFSSHPSTSLLHNEHNVPSREALRVSSNDFRYYGATGHPAGLNAACVSILTGPNVKHKVDPGGTNMVAPLYDQKQLLIPRDLIMMSMPGSEAPQVVIEKI